MKKMEWWKPLATDKINNNNLLLIILAQYHVNHSNDDAQLSNSVQFESLRTLFMIQSINNVSLFSRGNLILLGKHIRLNQSTMYFLTNFYIRCCCCSECVFRLQRIDSRSSDYIRFVDLPQFLTFLSALKCYTISFVLQRKLSVAFLHL